MKILINVLKWFKYNKKRSIPVLIITVWFLLFTTMKSSSDIAKALVAVVLLLAILLFPEIKFGTKKFIDYYKKL